MIWALSGGNPPSEYDPAELFDFLFSLVVVVVVVVVTFTIGQPCQRAVDSLRDLFRELSVLPSPSILLMRRNWQNKGVGVASSKLPHRPKYEFNVGPPSFDLKKIKIIKKKCVPFLLRVDKKIGTNRDRKKRRKKKSRRRGYVYYIGALVTTSMNWVVVVVVYSIDFSRLRSA